MSANLKRLDVLYRRLFSLIAAARFNALDPQDGLADVLDRVAGISMRSLDELLPWNRKKSTSAAAA
jgi:hypothetical protein